MSIAPSTPESEWLPLLVLRSLVLHPGQVATLEVAHPGNLLALECVQAGETFLAVPLLRPSRAIKAPNLAHVGVVAQLVQRYEMPGGALRIVVRADRRVGLSEVQLDRERFRARPGALANFVEDIASSACPAALRVLSLLEVLPELAHGDSLPLAEMLSLNSENAGELADRIASVLELEYRDALACLLEADASKRLELIETSLLRPRRAHHAGGVQSCSPLHDAPMRMRPADADSHDFEAHCFEQRIEASHLPQPARDQALRELEHFRLLRASSREAAAVRNYLDWLLHLPWPMEADRPRSLGFEGVEEVLSRSHAGLRDVKDRVIEHLAVRLLAGRAHGTMLCFLGPPGTGKSSMGRAVAEALQREFVQIPVGAVTEEEQLRGQPHRAEGALPGVILDSIQRSGTSAPIILIDEIDKLELGGSGTAGGALLDLLDADQNREFLDHYLGIPYDLSRCVFIVTATERDEIPEAVMDRLETIEFGGFTESEKLEIARGHLLPRARKEHGLEPHEFRISPAALRDVVRHYTEEAGVRNLQRQLNSLARKAALDVVRGGEGLSIKKCDLLALLGPATVDEEIQVRKPRVGVATGLAWTSAGGTLLPIEALAMPGSGRVTLTGFVGEVMRESVQTAISYVRTRFSSLGIKHTVMDELDVHLHFPSGSTPKDGPSAGIAIAAALYSLMTATPVRHNLVMSGEVSLHGNVLAVGGIKDKLLAAVRAGITTAIMPERNREEVLRLPEEIRSKLTIHLVGHVQAAIELALVAPTAAASKRGPQGRRLERDNGRTHGRRQSARKRRVEGPKGDGPISPRKAE